MQRTGTAIDSMSASSRGRTVLVTGGAGYIGTHILTVLASAGYRCVCIDNYANSSPRALERAITPTAISDEPPRAVAGRGREGLRAATREPSGRPSPEDRRRTCSRGR